MAGKVSVIIPVYNCAEYIAGCVESIQNQTYTNIEIILVNDGSKDGSEEVCKRITSSFSNVFFYCQENSGASVARNNGLSHATGDFIMFVDADDRIKPTIIEKLLECIESTTDIACCSYEILDPPKVELMFESAIKARTVTEKEPLFVQLMDYTYGHNQSNVTAIGVPWAKLYRKSFIDDNNLQFDSSLRRMQDNVFVMQTFYFAREVKYIPEPLYLYRVEHINTYTTVAYKPEVYLGVLGERHEFYEAHPDIITKLVKDYFYKEHINYLMMSIHYLVAQKEKKSSTIKKIRELCNNKIYKEVLKTSPTPSVSAKQKAQWLLYKIHAYNLLYMIYKKKYNIQ